jgi:chromosomal replication initiation ATPase DnaA
MNPDQVQIFIAVLCSLLNKNEESLSRFFIHGEAGTGKTFFLSCLQEACKEMVRLKS